MPAFGLGSRAEPPIRILDLEPGLAAARREGRIAALRDDPLQSELTSVAERQLAIAGMVFAKLDAVGMGEQPPKLAAAILEAAFDEPIAPGSSRLFRDFPLSKLGNDAIEVLRDRKLAATDGDFPMARWPRPIPERQIRNG